MGKVHAWYQQDFFAPVPVCLDCDCSQALYQKIKAADQCSIFSMIAAACPDAFPPASSLRHNSW